MLVSALGTILSPYPWWLVSELDWTIGHQGGVREWLWDQVGTLEELALRTVLAFWRRSSEKQPSLAVSAVSRKALSNTRRQSMFHFNRPFEVKEDRTLGE